MQGEPSAMPRRRTTDYRASREYSATQQSASMVRLMVTVERPPAEELAAYNRGDKYKQLLASNGQHRAELIDWIADHDLSDQVTQVGEATAFNVLFVEGTPEAAQSLSHAPGVVSVDVTGDFQMKPLH